jgi:hypothetical protein
MGTGESSMNLLQEFLITKSAVPSWVNFIRLMPEGSWLGFKGHQPGDDVLEITPPVRKLLAMVASGGGWIVNTGVTPGCFTGAMDYTLDDGRVRESPIGLSAYTLARHDLTLYRPHKQEASSPEEDRAFQALENALQAKKDSELGKIEKLETIQEVLHALADGHEINDGHCDWELSDFTDEINLLSDITLPCTIKPKTVKQVLWVWYDVSTDYIGRKWVNEGEDPKQSRFCYILHKVPTMTRETEE